MLLALKVVVVTGWATVLTLLAIRMGRHFLFQHADLVDTHRTRIPMMLATAAMVLYCVAGLAFGVAAALGVLTNGAGASAVFAGCLSCLPAGLAICGYLLSVPLWRRGLAWTPCHSDEWIGRVGRMARRMALSRSPRVAVSDRIALPVVVGRRSRAAYLVVPADWAPPANRPFRGRKDVRQFQLLHELAHCRNRDVGFMTWAHVFVRGLIPTAGAMLLAVAVVVAAGVFRWEAGLMILSAGSLALVTVVVLYRVVMREREFDADARAALHCGWPAGDLAAALDACEAAGLGPAGQTLRSKASRAWRFRLWLADRAAFGPLRGLWKRAHRIWGFMVRTHPSVAARKERLLGERKARPWRCPSVGHGIWSGIAAGTFVQGFLLASVAAAGIAAPGGSSANWAGNVILPFWGLGSACLLAVGLAFIALLPVRFCEEAGPPSLGYAGRLLAWFGVVAISGMAVLAISWPVLVEAGGLFALTIGIAYVGAISLGVLSGGLRESGESSWRAWLPTALTALLALAAAGGMELAIPGLGFAFTAGLWATAVVLSRPDDVTSWPEGYGIRRGLGPPRVLEGKPFRRWGVLAGWMLDLPRYLLPMLACGGLAAAAYLLICRWAGVLPARSSALMIGSGGLALMLVLSVFWVARRDRADPHCYGRVARCVTVLERWAPDRIAAHSQSNQRMALEVMEKGGGLRLPGRARTRLHLYWTCLPLLRQVGRDATAIGELVRQVWECAHAEGGFGPWPGASPRLSSTFQALGVLSWADSVDELSRQKQLAWLETLWRPDKGFCDPLLRYPSWQMTYWGLQCCEWLGRGAGPLARIWLDAGGRTEEFHARAKKPATERLCAQFWILRMAGHVCEQIEADLAGLCERRLMELASSRAGWFLAEYARIAELARYSSTISERISPLLREACRRVERVLANACTGPSV